MAQPEAKQVKKSFFQKLRELGKKQTVPVKETAALAEQKKFYEHALTQEVKTPVTPPTPQKVLTNTEPAVETLESQKVANHLTPPPTPPSSKLPVPPPLPEKKANKKPGSFFSHWFSRNKTQKLAEEREKELAWQERNRVEQRFWQPAQAVKPNLIKNQEVVFFNWHENVLILSLSLVMCCLAIGFIYVGLLIWQKDRVQDTQLALQNSKIIDQQIALGEQAAVEIKSFTIKLNAVSSLLDNHVYWTNFLKFLEDNTLKDVYLESFTGDISGEYTVPAVGKSLEAIALQLEVMKAYPKIKSLTADTGETNPDDETVKFNLGMSIDPTVFIK